MSVSLSRSNANFPAVPGWLSAFCASPLRISLAMHGALLLLFAVPALLLWLSAGPRFERIPIEFRDVAKVKPEAVPSIRSSETARTAPGRAVFGASRQSLRSTAEDAVEIKTGNTVTKEADQEQLTDADPDALPNPVDDFLVERMPEVLADVRVPYPAAAKANGVQGAVTLELLVDDAGAVRQARVVDGPGFGLNEAALEAAKRFRFRPATAEGGRAVAVKIRYAYRFVLER